MGWSTQGDPDVFETLRPELEQACRERRELGELRAVLGRRIYLKASALRGRAAHDFARDLAGCAKHQKFHPSPRRFCASVRCWIARHQLSLSRYQRTVRRNPSSSVTEGRHPSSASILDASMA